MERAKKGIRKALRHVAVKVLRFFCPHDYINFKTYTVKGKFHHSMECKRCGYIHVSRIKG